MEASVLETLGRDGDAFIECAGGAVVPVHSNRIAESRIFSRHVSTENASNETRTIFACPFFEQPHIRVFEWLYRDIRPFKFEDYRLNVLASACESLCMESLSVALFLHIIESHADTSYLRKRVKELRDDFGSDSTSATHPRTEAFLLCIAVLTIGPSFWAEYPALHTARMRSRGSHPVLTHLLQCSRSESQVW